MRCNRSGSASWTCLPQAIASGVPFAMRKPPDVGELRTGINYRKSLRDGRKVWVVGHGAVEDVITHLATRAMVDEYVAWYDRHFDPTWRDVVLNCDDKPWGYVLPKSADDLIGMG